VKKRTMAGIAAASFAVAVSVINASWIAPKPKGRLILVAHRGLAQQFPREGVGNDTCTATRIRWNEDNPYIENSLPSIYKAARLGADAVEVDVQQTRDGQMVLFHDAALECRTDGRGKIGDRTLAELKRLDIGYGYTADGGRTFPLRGRGIGGMPTVEEALREVPTIRLVFNFKSRDPKDADALVAAFARAGVPIDRKYSFYGDARVTGRLRQLVPTVWAYGKEEIQGCLEDYVKFGWTGYVPASCRDTTVAVPLNYQWAIWGWPNRFQARMAAVNTKVIMFTDYNDGVIAGIESVEQLDQVPRDFRGYLWIEDFYSVGRAVQR
jgi:glycerophosphoryl diester phosphodiesterase